MTQQALNTPCPGYVPPAAILSELADLATDGDDAAPSSRPPQPAAEARPRSDVTQEIDIGDIFEMSLADAHVAAKTMPRAPELTKPATRKPPVPKPALPNAAAAHVVLAAVPKPVVPKTGRKSQSEVTDVERIMLPVELPTLRNLKALTSFAAVRTLALETLRVPALTLAQAKSALSPSKTKATTTSRDEEKTRIHLPTLARTIARTVRALPTPIWASASAVIAAIIVGSAALIAGGQGGERALESPAIDVKIAEREEPSLAKKIAAQTIEASEAWARWSDVPTFVADVPVDSLPQR